MMNCKFQLSYITRGSRLRWLDPVFLLVHFPSLNLLDLNEFIFIENHYNTCIILRLNFILILFFGRLEYILHDNDVTRYLEIPVIDFCETSHNRGQAPKV